jgi:hypothetical protein
VAVVGRNVRKYEKDSTKGETINKTIQEHKIHKIENRNSKQKTNIKKNIKET